MKVSLSRKYDMLVRSATFGAKHQARFAAGTIGGQLFAEISTAVNEINEQEVARRLARTASADSRAEARQLLRQELVRIRNTARAIAVEEPLLVAFDLPSQSSDRALLDIARTFARDAEPVAARFVAHRLPETFLADLQARIATFAATIQRRTADRSSGHEASVRLVAAVEKGMTATRRLDAIVANEFRAEPELVAAWKLDRVIGPSRRQVRPTAPVPPSQGPSVGASDSPPTTIETTTVTTDHPAAVDSADGSPNDRDKAA